VELVRCIVLREKGRKASFDFVGFGILAIAVGALQVALDKGQEGDWFKSHFITTLLIIAAVGLVVLVIWEWFHKETIVDFHLFKIFNFRSSSLMFFVVGVVLFSSTVLLPRFLQTLMGYTAQKAGIVLSVAAILLLILLQVVGRLTTRFQARHILAFGWLTLAVGMYNMGDENVEELWYVFWLFKAIVSLSLSWAVALLCKWVLRCIRANRASVLSLKFAHKSERWSRGSGRRFCAKRMASDHGCGC
jgi:hypothetical protein